jgi:uncharacterized protein YciI
MELSFEEISGKISNHPVYVIIAETLDSWQSPATEEGKKVLHQHYLWLIDLKSRGILFLAGPLDWDLHSVKGNSAAGHSTGLIMLLADSRAQAEQFAFNDPFHKSGFRKNAIHSMAIRFADSEVSNALSRK